MTQDELLQLIDQSRREGWEKLDLKRIAIKRLAPKIADRLTTDGEMLTAASLNRRHAKRLFRRAGDLAQEFMQPGAELTTTVELVLDAAPVVLLEPGPAELADRVEADALRRIGRGLGQADAPQPFPQVSELLLGHVEHERHDLDGRIAGGHGSVSGHERSPYPRRRTAAGRCVRSGDDRAPVRHADGWSS